MNFFKRLSVSVRSQLDETVSRIENHDAVIDAALQESRDSIARLKLQQSHLSRKVQTIDTQLEKLGGDEQSWIRRAKSLAKTDEEHALACLDRRERCAKQIEQLKNKRDKCTEMEIQFANKISELVQKLTDDERRLLEFRGRDLSAKAEYVAQDAIGSELNSLEQAFDRWELDITRKEMRHDVVDAASSGSDAFEARLQREERMEARRAELKALLEDAS